MAPLKKLSIPRLKLCGGYLLSKLLTTMRLALDIPLNEVHTWSDSTIMLDSIPYRFKTFVGNSRPSSNTYLQQHGIMSLPRTTRRTARPEVSCLPNYCSTTCDEKVHHGFVSTPCRASLLSTQHTGDESNCVQCCDSGPSCVPFFSADAQASSIRMFSGL